MIENAFEVAKRADQDKGLEIVIEAGCGASLRLPMIGPEAHRRVPAKLVAVGGGVTRGNWVRVPVANACGDNRRSSWIADPPSGRLMN